MGILEHFKNIYDLILKKNTELLQRKFIFII